MAKKIGQPSPQGISFPHVFCLCFELYLVPRIFTELMKVPISILRRSNILIILILDDILLTARSQKEMVHVRDKLILHYKT